MLQDNGIVIAPTNLSRIFDKGFTWENGCRFHKLAGNGRKTCFSVSKSFIEKREGSYQNILRETETRYQMNQSIQLERAFGVPKNHYEFQRFLLRGKVNVKLKILLLRFGNDINKLHAKIR